MSACLPVRPSARPSVRPVVCLSVYVPACLPVGLSETLVHSVLHGGLPFSDTQKKAGSFSKTTSNFESCTVYSSAPYCLCVEFSGIVGVSGRRFTLRNEIPEDAMVNCVKPPISQRVEGEFTEDCLRAEATRFP